MFILNEQDTKVKCEITGESKNKINSFVYDLLHEVNEPERGNKANHFNAMLDKIVQEAFNAGMQYAEQNPVCKPPKKSYKEDLKTLTEIGNDTNFMLGEIQTLLRDRLS